LGRGLKGAAAVAAQVQDVTRRALGKEFMGRGLHSKTTNTNKNHDPPFLKKKHEPVFRALRSRALRPAALAR
jgi:hypothetical protein